MSEDLKGSSGAPIDTTSGGSGNGKDVVAYDTYKKAIGEVKKLKEALDSVMSERQQAEQAALAEQGKYKEIADKYEKELKQTQDLLRKKDSMFVEQNLKQSVARIAKELGAKDEAVDEIFTVGRAKEYFKSIEVKDDYSVNTDHVKAAMSELAQKSPWFFQNKAQAPKDVVIGGTKVTTDTDIKNMPKEKLLEAYKNLLNK